MVYIPESEKIYFQNIKCYFSEVISNYSDGRYRSAVVILYSIVICDLLLKLNELVDVYNDNEAKKLLDNINEARYSKENSKSKWELDLVEQIYKETNLLDLATYKNLIHLRDHRNLSAHPALNENYELFEPSKEITVCHIKNMLEGVLIKPPIFITNVFNMLVNDLAEKKDIYEKDKDKFHDYVSRKYFSRMTNDMKKKIFRSLWKLCFTLPNDDKCTVNIKLNMWTMDFLYDEIPDICNYIKSDTMFARLSTDDTCCLRLSVFLAKNPKAYLFLSDETKSVINSFVEKNAASKQISWFINCDYKDHIKKLMSEVYYSNIDNSIFNFMKNTYENIGELAIFVDYCIDHFLKSRNFFQADNRYDNVIHSLLSNMTRDQYITLISGINTNDQIYRRNAAYYSNTEIVSYALSILGKDFDFSQYQNFTFDSTRILSNNDNEENDNSLDLDNILSL